MELCFSAFKRNNSGVIPECQSYFHCAIPSGLQQWDNQGKMRYLEKYV